MIGALLRHLDRLGGVLVRPRRTLAGVLWDGDGRLFEVVVWMVVVAMATEPVRAGQAFLVARTSLVDGASAFLSLLAARMLGPLAGALVGGTILHLVDRLRGSPHGVTFDMAVDACAFALVPFLLLSASGAALRELDLEVWFLPHRALGGRGWIFVARIAAGYGWSIALFGVLLREVWRPAYAPPG